MKLSTAAIAAIAVAAIPALLMWALVVGTHEPGGYAMVSMEGEW